MIFPVCAPALAARLRDPADLRGVACLTDAVWADDWANWMQAAAPAETFTPRGPVFSLYALAVAEAVNGAGVLMGHEALIRAELAHGRLVAPFSHRVTLPRILSATRMPGRSGSAAERVVALLRTQAP